MSLLKPAVKNILNDAAGRELYARNLYLNIANRLEAIGYFGAAKYFRKEADQEASHYGILAEYFNARNDCADVSMVPFQMDNPMSLHNAFEISYEAEHSLGLFYENAYEKCEEEYEPSEETLKKEPEEQEMDKMMGDTYDCTTAQFLLQFIEIQRKSVGGVKDIISMLKIAGDNPAALLMVDAKLGA